MGYILPITQYEYINYKTRDIKSKQKMNQVGKVYKVILSIEQENLKNAYDKIDKKQEKVFSDRVINRPDDVRNFNPAHYAMVTGKGGIVSEEV